MILLFGQSVALPAPPRGTPPAGRIRAFAQPFIAPKPVPPPFVPGALVFQDEAGQPFPPGILVAITDASGNPVGAGYTQVGGLTYITVQPAVPYTASFAGTQAPTAPQAFVGNSIPNTSSIVQVSGYRSPALNADGYTTLATSMLPLRRFAPASLVAGGGWYATAGIFGSGAAMLDSETQQLRGALRAQTAQGLDIDSWAADFFGVALPRYQNETDAVYYSRIAAAFGPRCTLAAIQQIVVQFYAATLAQRIASQQQNLTFDALGGYDTRGGYDVVVAPQTAQALTPTVQVWDSFSLPQLAAQYGIYAGEFVVQIGFTGAATGWYLDHSALDVATALIDGNTVQTSATPPDARLGALVNLVKASGMKPLYQTYSN